MSAISEYSPLCVFVPDHVDEKARLTYVHVKSDHLIFLNIRRTIKKFYHSIQWAVLYSIYVDLEYVSYTIKEIDTII